VSNLERKVDPHLRSRHVAHRLSIVVIDVDLLEYHSICFRIYGRQIRTSPLHACLLVLWSIAHHYIAISFLAVQHREISIVWREIFIVVFGSKMYFDEISRFL
jgi:hypothetical protein